MQHRACKKHGLAPPPSVGSTQEEDLRRDAHFVLGIDSWIGDEDIPDANKRRRQLAFDVCRRTPEVARSLSASRAGGDRRCRRSEFRWVLVIRPFPPRLDIVIFLIQRRLDIDGTNVNDFGGLLGRWLLCCTEFWDEREP